MPIYHREIRGRTRTGAKVTRYWKVKRKYHIGRPPAETRVGERRAKKIRTKGGNLKMRLLSDQIVNLADPNTGETKKVRIVEFIDNKASKILARRRIITKGALIMTEDGLARVTSRPGQSGVINAVKVEE